MPDRDPVRDARAQATILLRELRSRDSTTVYRAAARFRALPQFQHASLTDVYLAIGRLQRRHALDVIAREWGHVDWAALTAMHGQVQPAPRRRTFQLSSTDPERAIGRFQRVLLDVALAHGIAPQCRCSDPNCPSSRVEAISVDDLLQAFRQHRDMRSGLVLPKLTLDQSIEVGETLRPHLIRFAEAFGLLDQLRCPCGAPGCPNENAATMTPAYLVQQVATAWHGKSGCLEHSQRPADTARQDATIADNLKVAAGLGAFLVERRDEWRGWVDAFEARAGTLWFRECRHFGGHVLERHRPRLNRDLRMYGAATIIRRLAEHYKTEAGIDMGDSALMAVLLHDIADDDVVATLAGTVLEEMDAPTMIAAAEDVSPDLYLLPDSVMPANGGTEPNEEENS
jgi:hypothetical protein